MKQIISFLAGILWLITVKENVFILPAFVFTMWSLDLIING